MIDLPVSSLADCSLRMLAAEHRVSEEDQAIRRELVLKLRERVPPDVWPRVEYLQPQVGCFNRCAFCSQSAGTEIWQLTERGLRNLLSAIKTILSDQAQESRNWIVPASSARQAANDEASSPSAAMIGQERKEHKPGVIFPYLDNDIFSYPYLYEYIQSLYEDFGVKVRLTTVGYSRNNAELDAMHRKVVATLPDAIHGLRFSFTPYTLGWREGANSLTSREEFIQDVANTFKVYRPIVERLGVGKETACTELRFKPLVFSEGTPLNEGLIDSHHFIQTGCYLLLSVEPAREFNLTRIQSLVKTRPVYTTEGVPYYLIVSDAAARSGDWQTPAREVLRRQLEPDGGTLKRLFQGAYTRRCLVYQFSNDDGPYYAVDPFFDSRGYFQALHIYPQTATRPRSGYIDSSRPMLNSIISYKEKLGLKRRQALTNATWEDVDNVLADVDETAAAAREYNARYSDHVRQHIRPMMAAYRQVLLQADYEASYFFDRRFTIDTGQIVNQGRAITEFGQLVTHRNHPVTPHEERGYGIVSFNARRGKVWRIAPTLLARSGETITPSAGGRRNSPTAVSGVEFSELDGWLRRTERATIFLEGVEVERVKSSRSHPDYLQPGVKSKE